MAAPPVGTGDASTQQLLDQAYADSRQQLQGAGIPSNLTQPYKGPGIQRGSVTLAPPGQPQQPNVDLTPTETPPEGAEDPFAEYGNTPPPQATPVPKDTHGNGDVWSWSNLKDFTRDSFQGVHPVDAIMSSLAGTGGVVTALTAGAAARVADKTADLVTGREGHSQAEDAVFDWKKNHIDTAVDSWEPKQEDGTAPGGAAEFINNTAKIVPNLLTGGVGFGTMIVKSGMDTATQAVDSGKTTKEAMTLGAVDALTTAAFAAVSKFGGGATFAKRVVKQIPAGAVAQFVGDFTKKAVLTANGHHDEADKIDLLDSQLQAAITNSMFALLPHAVAKDKATTAAGVPDPTAAPMPDAEPVPAVAGTPAPATPPVVASQGDTAPTKVQAAPPVVADKPSPEPAKDYAAQWKDMNAALTPRVGVLVPKGATNTGIEKGIEQAKAQGRTIDLDQGTLVLKNKGEMLKAQNALKSGEDPQAVIGKATGAGFGKTPEQTHVVQGQTKDGAVASESMVKPEEVAAKVQQMKDEGKTPVVTTPEAAVQRRSDEIDGQLPEGAEPVADKKVEPVTEPEASDEEPKQQRAIVNGKAVVIEGDKARVLDADGEPTDEVIPHGSASSESTPTKESTPQNIDKATGEAKKAYPPPERRTDTEGRKKVSEMSDEEKSKALLTNPVSGIPNARAYEEAPRKSTQVHIDLDSLKAVNDTAGHEAGDHVIKAVAEALHSESKDTYHVSGDEFKAQADTPDEAHALMKRVNDRLSNAAVEVTMPDGRVLKLKGLGVSYGVGEHGQQAEAGLQTNKAERQARGERSPRGELPPGATVEGAEAGRKSDEGNASPQVKELIAARDQFKQQETPAKGRKTPTSVKDRAANVAAFARALRATADRLNGKAPAADLQHAVKMAKAAERLDLKSDEAISKGQGIGHTELATHADNMLHAAEKLINPDHVIPDPKVSRQEKLKAKIAKAKAYTMEQPKGLQTKEEIEAFNARMLGTTPEEVQRRIDSVDKPKFKTAIKDVPDERPVSKEKRTVTKGDELKLKGAGERLMRADDGDLDAHIGEIDKMISDIYGDSFSKSDRKEFMTSLLEMRAERRGDNKASGKAAREAEIDREMSDFRDGEGHDEEPNEYEARILGSHEVSPELAELHARLEKSGAYPKLREAVANGHQYNLQKFLFHMAGNTPTGPLRDFLHKLAAHTPATDALRPVTTPINSTTGQPTSGAGLYERAHGLVQVKVNGPDSRLTHAIIHEATHAATVHLAASDPTHPFVRESKRLRQVFENRLRARLGDDVVQAHLDFHNGGAKPADLINNLYGLKNHLEFMAEAVSNPKFQQLISESEAHVQANEGSFLGGAHKLADAVVGAIRRALNIFKPREAKLLAAVLHNTENIMEHQKLQFEAPTVGEDMAALHSLNDEPHELRGVGEPLRRIVGDKASDTARDFVNAIKKNTPRALRRLVLANEAHDQIVRSNSHWFGRDDETNPLRKWSAVKEDAAAIQNRALAKSADVVKTRQRLDRAEDRSLGELQRDATQFGLDPSLPKDQQTAGTQGAKGFDKRYDEYTARWNKLSPEAKSVFTGERDANKWMQTQMRKAGVDLAIEAHDGNISDAQKSLLYSIKNKAEYADHIGVGKDIDLGEHNDKLTRTLEDLAAVGHQGGPYFHLGRQGDYVVQVSPEGTKEFGSKAEAEDYAAKVREFGPTSKAKVAERGGKHVVDYKANYVSMHEHASQAETERENLIKQGHDVPVVSTKLEAAEGGALTKGLESMVGEVTRKLGRNGGGEEVKAMTDALRTSFVQMMAQRSAYASSKLARRGFGGVKGEEMGRNFAAHTASNAWHLANMKTTMASGEALGRVRELSKLDPEASQKVMYKRGAVMRELSKRTAQEVSQMGIKNPASAISSKLGFANFLASPGHMIVNLTQNFTTAMPVAGAKWGYGRSTAAFARAHAAVFGPTVRASGKALKPGAFTAEDMFHDVLDQVAQHPTMGKWAKGENSALRQLMDRGIITNSFATELGNIGKQGINSGLQRAYDYGRILPQIAEVYNRITTALVGLEMTKGDVTKTADFVRESHVDYSQANKTRAGKMLTKVPFGNTVTMFRTYVQGMRHLLYSNVKNMVYAETKSRAEAAKTVAGLILAQSIFAGAIKGAALEPLRGIHYLWNQLFGDADEYSNLDNSMRHFISDAVGNKTVADAISGGLPHLLGFDLSGRMGLSDLFLHDPPDLLHSDTKEKMAFLGKQLGGPMGEMVAQEIDGVTKAYDKGDVFGMIMAMMPLKLLRDGMDSYQLLTKGHLTGNGAQVTPPSKLDAVYRAMGLKPADVARVQEKAGTAIEYKDFADNRKQRLLKAWASGDAEQKRGVRAEILKYNNANRGQAIKPKDLVNQGRGKLMAEREAKGGKGRDPVTNKLLDY